MSAKSLNFQMLNPTLMHRFDEDEAEPVAVVRTLSDFALALTLIVLMLVGSRAAVSDKRAVDTRAAVNAAGASTAALKLRLLANGEFGPGHLADSDVSSPATALAEKWTAAHPTESATIVLQFPPKTLATDLHRALLELQSAFGTNLSRLDTVPQL
jgi:hypothetical protein